VTYPVVDFQVVLVPIQVVNANPSDSQVYLDGKVTFCINWLDVSILQEHRLSDVNFDQQSFTSCGYQQCGTPSAPHSSLLLNTFENLPLFGWWWTPSGAIVGFLWF